MKALLPVLVTIVGCGPPSGGYADDVPDAEGIDAHDCRGDVRILAPVANLHYDAGLEVYIDENESYGDLEQWITDSHGQYYTYTDSSSVTDTNGTIHERFHYDLAPSEHYTLTVIHCYETQTISFFTSTP